jgi:hypothetical protein
MVDICFREVSFHFMCSFWKIQVDIRQLTVLSRPFGGFGGVSTKSSRLLDIMSVENYFLGC